VGAPIWNKGMDLVIEAFFAARQGNPNLRLLIKDQQALYGMTAVKMMQDMAAQGRIRITDADVAAISVIPKTLSMEQLRSLYGVADYYLSPYRAEGFNLPVIEALACGTPVIVSAGGSTDDFCDATTAVRIPTTFAANVEVAGTRLGACLMPDMAALTEILVQCARGEVHLRRHMAFGRVDLLEKFTWRRAANLITALL
jgi:glycosyltransferase involved in cell wall biosynthesis